MLDAGLLAEVYIRMTRGQKNLVIESEDSGATGAQTVELAAMDLSGFSLPVLDATEDEATAHRAVLADLDKSGTALAHWQNLVA